MKKNRGLIIAAAVLVVLLAVYFGLRAWNAQQEKEKQARDDAEKVYVTDTDPDDIVSLSLNVGNGDMTFEKESDIWYYTQDRDFPLNQSYPQDMIKAAGQMEADRKLDDGDELSDYGLDEPSYTVEYTDSEGNMTTLYFGNSTGDCYYVTVNDTGVVYTVSASVIEDLNYSLDDMAQLDDYPDIGSGNLVREVITQNGETTTYDSENDDQAEDIAAVAGGLGAVSLSDVADYSVEDSDLPDYGLDEASRTAVEVTYTKNDEEQVLRLYMGTSDGDGSRYVMINDSRIVYLVSEEICDNVLNIDDDTQSESETAEE